MSLPSTSPAQLGTQLGSMSRGLELFYVLAESKPCCRLAVPEHVLPQLRHICREHCLLLAVSPHTVELVRDYDNPLSFYSTKGYATKGRLAERSDDKEKHWHRFCYVAAKQGIAKQALEAEMAQNHALLGRLLGYPKCCISFFTEHFGSEARNSLDFVMPAVSSAAIAGATAAAATATAATGATPAAAPAAIATAPAGRSLSLLSLPLVMNLFIRSFDRHLLSHAPCSFTCEQSQRQAAERLRLLARADAGLHAEITALLGHAVVYSPEGMALLDCRQTARSQDAERHYLIRHVLVPHETALGNAVLKQLRLGQKELVVRDDAVVLGRKQLRAVFLRFQ